MKEVVSADPTKAAYDARKRAIKEEKDARLKRLENAAGELTQGIEDVKNTHNFLSILEQEKHSAKGSHNPTLTTAIAQLAGALTSMQIYSRGIDGKK